MIVSAVLFIVAFFCLFVFGILVGAYIGTSVITKRIEPLATQQRETFMKALEGYLLPVAAEQARSIADLKGQANVLSAITKFFAGERFEFRVVLKNGGDTMERVYGYDWSETTKSFVYPLPTYLVMRYAHSVAAQQPADRRAEKARFN